MILGTFGSGEGEEVEEEAEVEVDKGEPERTGGVVPVLLLRGLDRVGELLMGAVGVEGLLEKGVVGVEVVGVEGVEQIGEAETETVGEEGGKWRLLVALADLSLSLSFDVTLESRLVTLVAASDLNILLRPFKDQRGNYHF